MNLLFFQEIDFSGEVSSVKKKLDANYILTDLFKRGSVDETNQWIAVSFDHKNYLGFDFSQNLIFHIQYILFLVVFFVELMKI